MKKSIDYNLFLNAEQLEVVENGEGPCLVLAGAGTGKTRVLIYRIAYLLERGISPDSIMLATFTNKAAKEMNGRIESLLGRRPQGLWSGTFHHIGNRILRMYGKDIGLGGNFQIFDRDDSRQLIGQCIKMLEFNKLDIRLPKTSVIQSIISFSENSKRSIDETLTTRYGYLEDYRDQIKEIAVAYKSEKEKSKSLDYDDLLTKWLQLLEKSPATLDKLAGRFKYILVDEYQDTNIIQSKIIQLLSKHHKNILVVGDDAQSIYSFRAALVQNILNFPDTYPNVKTFKLQTNYRSTPEILNLANDSISHNFKQFQKPLRTQNPSGEVPVQISIRNKPAETRFIIQRIEELMREGSQLADMAVLYRAHYHSAHLEMNLIKRSIPYTIRGGIRFFEQAHVKDALSFVRIATNAHDRVAWIRALCLMEGIGLAGAEKIYAACSGDVDKLLSMRPNISRRSQAGFARFKAIVKSLWRDRSNLLPHLMIEKVLENGYQEHLLLSFENAKDRLDDLEELIRFARSYKSAEDFLAEVSLGEGYKGQTNLHGQESGEELVLSTIHQAKGLEWDTVFILGLTEGQFPHSHSYADESQFEEERRLFYVAITRSKINLYLLSPQEGIGRQGVGQVKDISSFVSELESDTYDSWEIQEDDHSDLACIDLDTI